MTDNSLMEVQVLNLTRYYLSTYSGMMYMKEKLVKLPWRWVLIRCHSLLQ